MRPRFAVSGPEVSIDGPTAYLMGHEISALDLKSKKLLWSTKLPTQNQFPPPLACPEHLYVPTARGIFDIVRRGVQIAQKTVKDSPQDKLIDILMTLLSGAQSLVQLNTLLRSDPALQQSVGRQRCSEQSVAQQTLDAATCENVDQMQQVLTTLFRQHSQAASHSYRSDWLILDVDLTGMPCGKKAEKSTKGYFGQHRSRRGRKPRRVLASQYGEIVVDALYPGNTLLLGALPSLIEMAEQVLASTPFKRKHTIIRLDAGGGSVASLNSLLSRGYAVVGKDYSAQRVSRLVKSVTQWVEDPDQPGRQVGWVREESLEYVRPVRRLAVRCKSAKGRWQYAVLLFAGLSDQDILTLMEEPQRADAASDFNVEFFEKLVAEFYVVDSGGNHHGSDGDEAVLWIFHEHF